jgi:hypothetical protein
MRVMSGLRSLVSCCVVLAAVAAPRAAAADDEIARGSIVKIEAQEIYISIGVEKGVSGGSAVRIKRPVSLKHPVTRATVQDWIPIGSASVTQAGSVMSRAVIGTLVDAVKVGDVAEVLVDRPDTVRPVEVVPAAGPQAPPVDQATAEVLGLFAAQAGQTIESRIAAWERYLSMRATSPFAIGIRKDLEELHTLRDQMRPPTTSQSSGPIVSVSHEPPTSAISGTSIPFVFVLDHPERVASGYLHYRARGNRTYKSLLLVREHDIYLRAALPAEAVTAPGLDYFVEVSTPQGASGTAFGSPLDPIGIDVARPTMLEHFDSAPGRSSVKIAGDYMSFSSLDTRDGDRTDTMVTANVDFMYRLRSHIESIGVGYGVYAGRGGYEDRVYTDAMPFERSGFHYGYADVEVGGDTSGVHVSGGGQLIAGVGKDGFGLGAEGRVRIGHRDATNLAIIARTVEQVGFLSDIRFGARPVDGMLLGISVGATNQPNQGDVGVKLGTEVEFIAIRNFSLILRASWQGRSTAHGGLGAGAGLGAYW